MKKIYVIMAFCILLHLGVCAMELDRGLDTPFNPNLSLVSQGVNPIDIPKAVEKNNIEIVNFTVKEQAIIEILNKHQIGESRLLIKVASLADKCFLDASERLKLIKQMRIEDSLVLSQVAGKKNSVSEITVHVGDDQQLDVLWGNLNKSLVLYVEYSRKIFATTSDDLIPSWQELAEMMRKLSKKEPHNTLLR